MYSAFGVDHGEVVAKLGPPQYRGRSMTVYSQDKKSGESKIHSPTHLSVTDTKKKTLLLRRPKYRFAATPETMDFNTETHNYFAKPSGLVRPNKASREAIHAHVTSKDKHKSKNIGGLQTRLRKD